MQFITAVTLALFSTAAFAVPAPEPVANATHSLAARADGGVYYCTDVGYNPPCEHFQFTNGVCHDFLPGTAFYKTISAFGPDQGATCEMRPGAGCTGTGLTITYPGQSDLRNWHFNDQIVSIRCTQTG